MMGLLLGIGGGLLIGGLIQRRRACRHGHHRRGPWGLLRALELDPRQRHDLRGLFYELRETAAGMRGRDDWMRLVEALAQPSFDRAKVEAVAAEKTAAFERLRGQAISAIERAHAILRPDQRAKLADWFQVGFAPAGGPYR
jgi:Spy/CpxP family protein refolding chaperone